MSRPLLFAWVCALALLTLFAWVLADTLLSAGDVADGERETRIRVTLPWGGTALVPESPRRVIPGNAGAADLLSELLSPDRIVALPAQAFTWSRLAADPRGFTKHPRFAKFIAESLLEHEPDLVLSDSINTEDTARRLREADVCVLTLPDVSRIETTLEVLSFLGGVLGETEKAERMVSDLRRRMEALEKSSGPRSRFRAITYANYGSTGICGGEGTTNAEILRLAGVPNAAIEIAKKGSARLSFEELLGLDPDLIIVATEEQGKPSASRTVLENTPALSSLKALQSGGIIEIPTRLLSTTSHELVRAAEALARRIDTRLESGR